MNLLYEAMKEKASMIIVPSSAVETMGLGGTLATAAIALAQTRLCRCMTRCKLRGDFSITREPKCAFSP